MNIFSILVTYIKIALKIWISDSLRICIRNIYLPGKHNKQEQQYYPGNINYQISYAL